MMGFTASGFWVAFFMQEVQKLPTITVAVHLLPMAVAGLMWNIVAGRILHLVNNTAIMFVGAVCYLGAGLLFSFMRADSTYWAFIFPALILNVAGADLQFNVANVGYVHSFIYALVSFLNRSEQIAANLETRCMLCSPCRLTSSL